MANQRKYSQKKQFSNVYTHDYNTNSFENFWTKEPHRYTEHQRKIVEDRMIKKYMQVHEQAYNECCDILGFDINSDFFIKTPFKIKNFPQSRPIIQSEVIPLSEKVLNKIISAPKYFLFKQEYRQDKKDKPYYCTTSFYCAIVEEQPVIFTMTTRIGSKDDINIHPLNSISTHILLKGKVPFLVSRFDTKPSAHHPNKFTPEGELATDKVHVKGPHEHVYNEKLCVVFPFKKFIGHYDALPCPTFQKFSQAVRFIKNKYNIKDKVFDNDNEIFVNLPKIKSENEENAKKIPTTNKNHLHKEQEDDIINMLNF